MKKALAAATTWLATTNVALAGGDSGTSAMGEMQLTGKHFLMMVGGLAALGVVIWLLAKFTSR